MNLIRGAIAQPVTVTVAVILTIMAGLIAITRIPIQLTPTIEDTIISVTTRWEGASPYEIEQDIIDKQEEKLQGLTNLRSMTSTSMQGEGQIRLEFNVGTSKAEALREVSDKLREVDSYPLNAKQPVVRASDPENRDYIAWIVFETTDPDFDIRTLQDFAENRIKPVLERVPGVSEINVLGGREREAQIRFNPVRLAQRGVSPADLVNAIQRANRDISAGELDDAKVAVRVRTISQYESVEDVEQTIVKHTPTGPVLIRDVAEVVEAYKEPISFVRSRGQPVIAINAQREVGSNVMQVMDGLKQAIARLNMPGGLLESEARRLNLNGTLTLRQVFDQTIYIHDALALVRDNIWMGGSLAIIVLLLFLRSIRSVIVISLAIPISVVGAIVAMVVLGRTINVISLAGMAFAVGMVVDNAIVVLENIFRHLEMGKRPAQAAFDAAREVWGAVLASTLTTLVVFVPILLVEEEAGQLFRDIALAICAAIALSLIVSITVVPSAAARVLKSIPSRQPAEKQPIDSKNRSAGRAIINVLLLPWRIIRSIGATLGRIPAALAWSIYALCGSVGARVAVVLIMTAISLFGTYWLLPPSDYLPTGNRNLIFGLMIPPPGYSLDQQAVLANRVEQTIRPFWEAGALQPGTPEYEQAVANLPQIPTFDYRRMAPGDPVTPPPIDNYFFVARPGAMFHGAISTDPTRVVDVQPLLTYATRPEVAPGVLAFARQVPLFRLGGSSGSAVKIDFSGVNLDKVTAAAGAAYGQLVQKYGAFTVQPVPSNFDIPGPELQVIPNRVRLAEVGMTPVDLGLAVQAGGDGAIIGEYRTGSETIDLKLISRDSIDQKVIAGLEDMPIATPSGRVVPLGSLAELRRVGSPPQITRIARQRSVTLEFTPPAWLALEQAVMEIDAILSDLRSSGAIPPDVETGYTGSASKLKAVQEALLGDGTALGLISSSLVLALVVVYLLMCVLFQSFLQPFVIMFSVPLATLGGFAALFAVNRWTEADPYMPVQKLDVLTMLGFIILIGIVVNNAILLVHQALNFMHGTGDVGGVDGPLPARRAIAESVRSRVRPIMMSTLTSVLAMSPLVLMPGAGSELYRGLGAVVLGGLLVSAIFTLVLVPLLWSLVMDIRAGVIRVWASEPSSGSGAMIAGVPRSPES